MFASTGTADQDGATLLGDNVRITNVYNQTIVINNVNRVSFNGGNGGIQARPTPQQEAFARERHVEATPVQRQHAEIASKDRSLFSKQNHGEPAIAATARPGVLQGEGVVRASRTPVAPTGEPGRPGQSPAAQGRQPPRPGEPPRVNETGREPPAGVEERVPAEEPRRAQQEGPKAEPPRVETRPEVRPEPPKVEERTAPAPRVEERRPERRL